MGRQQQREQHRDRQGTDVVEGEHLGDQVLELHLALEDAHDQRDLQPDQDADQQHQAVEREAEGPGMQGEQEEQQPRRDAAEQADQQLDLDEAQQQVSRHVLRQPGTDAHGEQVGADHRRELGHRVAEQVAGQRAGDEFVGQPAGGDDEDRGQQRTLHYRETAKPALSEIERSEPINSPAPGRGRRRGFAKRCFAPPQPAGCAKPAVGRGWGANLLAPSGMQAMSFISRNG
jgi:hypothetical protein